VTSIGFGNVNIFVGAGPYFVDSNGVDGINDDDTPDSDAAGLLLKDVTLAIALFKPTDTSDTSSYHAFSAFAYDIDLIGLDLGSESFTLDASGYRLEYSSGTDGVTGQTSAINFTALAGGKLTVPTGVGSVDLDYSSALLRVALGNATLIIGDYIHVSGGFAFTYQQSLSVTLNDTNGTIRTVDAYAFGAGSVDVFVGDGPYFVDANPVDDDDGFVDGRNENAVGLALENVNFGLLLMKPTDMAYKSTKYIALQANADRVGLVGIDVLELSATGVSVEFNSVNNSANPNDKVVVDFSLNNYLLDTGNGVLVFKHSKNLMRASIAEANLRIDSYVFVNGALAFEKGEALDLIDSNGGSLLNASSINIGASGLTMFVGINGPWTDVDGDGKLSWAMPDGTTLTNPDGSPMAPVGNYGDLNGDDIIDVGETAELNASAVGLAISNADLAMALITSSSGVDKYLGLRASSDQVGFVGVDVFGLEASRVQVELNLGATETAPVVDFEASYPGEQQALFDLLAAGDAEISAADLTAAFINDFGVTDALTTADELIALLNIGGAPTLTDLTALITDSAIATEVTALDSDNDNKLDPVGYEILTGAGSEYLSETKRRILATADNVYVNVADFLYVKGSIAIDLGTREVVTINTGIPAAFAGLISSIDPGLVDTLNSLLDSFSANLTNLRSQIQAAFQNAVNTVKTTIQDTVADIVTNIKAQLNAAIEDAKSFVSGELGSVLDNDTGALSIDSIVDGVINTVVDSIPNDALLQPLKGLVREILSPLKSLLNNAFGDLLQQALSGTIERIAGSVSAAVDAAAGKVGPAIDNAIQSVIDPQITRIELMLDRLIARIDATIAPIFTRIQSIANINFGSAFATMENVEVEVTAIGISNATAFVGIPPEGGFDRGIPFAEQYTAMGLLIEDFNMGLAMFKPIAGELLPTFVASKISVDTVLFRIGDGDDITTNDPFTLVAQNIVVDLNLGGSIIPGAGAIFGTATIDFQASFPADDGTTGNPPKPVGYEVPTGTTTTPIYIDFKGELLIRAIVGNATIQISNFVYITGSFAFEMGGVATVQVADSLLPVSELEEFAAILGLDLSILEGIPPESLIPAVGATEAEMRFMTIGAAGVHAFVGMKGPYWTDADLDGVIDTNEINSDAIGIVINDFDFGMALMAPTNILDFVRYFALKASAEQLALVGLQDVVLTADKMLVEINSSTPGVYGIPLFPVVDFASTYQSERKALFDIFDADGNQVIETGEMNYALDGGYAGDDITSVQQLVELLDTMGAPPSGVGADSILSLDEVLDRLSDSYKTTTELSQNLTNEDRIRVLDADNDEKFDPAGYEVTTGGEPVYLDMDSALLRAQGFVELNLFDSVILTGSVAFELGPVETVTLTDDSTKDVTTMTIGAANVTAFVGYNGPYWTDLDGDQQVSWSDAAGTPLTGADSNGNGDVDAGETAELNESAIGMHITDLDMGIMLMAAISPIDPGVYLATKISVEDFGFVGVPGFTASGAFDVELNVGFGLSGVVPSLAVVDFDASFNEVYALFDVIDVGNNGIIETSELDSALEAGASYADEILSFFDANDDQEITVEDLRALTTQTEVAGLFDEASLDADVLSSRALIDSLGGGDGVLDLADVALFGDGAGGITASAADADGDGRLEPIGGNISTVEQLVSALNIGGAPPVDGLPVADLLNVLSASFKTTANLDAIQAADADGDGKLDFGFEVNTGNAAAPVVLDFDQFLISIRLGGEIELNNVFRMYGVFLFEVDSSGLKAFVATGLEIGPDIGSTSKIFNMNALGALVINGDGVAADIEISVSIGGALRDVLQLNATARLVFNTTSQNQTITIPAKYVDFLIGNDSIPVSEDYDTSLVSGLTLTQQELIDRFGYDPNVGTATYTIFDRAPGQANAGFYVLATFDAVLRVANTFEIDAAFRLLLTGQSFELGFTGSLGLGGFGSFTVAGGAVIDSNGFAAYGLLDVNIDVLGLVQVSGSAELLINTATSGDPVTIDLGNGNSPGIDPNTYLVAIDATINLFGVVSAQGDVELGIDSGVFVIAVNQLNINLLGLNLDISGFIRSDGQFSLSGALLLDLTAGGFGIDGQVSVSISNSGFTGSGSVAIVLFGQSFNIAAAELSVTSNPASVFIRADGPLGVYLTVLIDSSGTGTFDGGLGFLDDIIGAIGDVAEAVGDAVVDAVNVVADAIEDLGQAILDFGEDVIEFLDGLLTDLGNLIGDVVDEIASWFSSSKTEVVDLTDNISATYSYSASLSGGTLTIDNNSASRIALAIVGNNLIVDAPDETQSVVVAQEVYYTRYFRWWGPIPLGWSSWSERSRTDIYRTITFSNMTSFTAGSVSKIVINGSDASETIVLDRASINIAAEVYGNGGADTIITGGGNDYIEGGSGNDIIFTYGGNDTVYGDVKNNNQSTGNDVLVGGIGNDILIGGPGDDVLDESQNRGNNPDVLLTEQNILYGGLGEDVILGSPGKDIIVGGDGDDVMTGLNNDDTYVFYNGYGTDTFADYFGKSVLDFSQVALNDYSGNPILSFSGVTNDLHISISDTGFNANTDVAGDLFLVDGFIQIAQYENAQQVKPYDDFEIAEIRTGTGDDDVVVTALPLYRMDIIDAGGSDTYDFNFVPPDGDQYVPGQNVARVDIVDDVVNDDGIDDQIDLYLDSTGFGNIYLHPQEVLLNNLHISFNSGIEYFNLADHAAQTETTTITTEPNNGPASLLVKTGVTITSFTDAPIELLARDNITLQAGSLVDTDGPIELLARNNITLQAGSLVNTAGSVVIRGDTDAGADPAGSIINLLGTIDANQVEVHGDDDDDIVNVTNVTSGSETTIWTYGGSDIVNIQSIDADTTVHAGQDNDTVNVGSSAPATGGNLNGISASLVVNGDGGTDTLNLDDTGDANANSGTLTATGITDLGMSMGVDYGTLEHLNISLGDGGNTFTINSTHGGTTTTVNSGDGVDTIHINDANGTLVVNGEAAGDIINVNGTSTGSGLTVNGNGGDDVINVKAMDGTTTVNTGSGVNTVNAGSTAPNTDGNVNGIVGQLVIHGQSTDDTLNVYDKEAGTETGNLTATDITGLDLGVGINYNDATDKAETLNIYLGARADTFNILSTEAATTTTLNTDGGNDVINVQSIAAGLTTVNTGSDVNTVNVGSTAPNTDGNLNAIVGQLVICGQSADDTLNLYDKEAGTETGNLTATDITGLDLGVGINYNVASDNVETLNIFLGARVDIFNILSTNAATTTTLNTAQGTDTVNINDASGLVTVNTEEDNDIINVLATSLGSEVRVNSHEGDDVINLSDQSPTLPTYYPSVLPPPAADTVGNINGIDGLVVINGGSEYDQINVDDSANTSNKYGKLTSDTLRGLELEGGVDYTEAEDLNIWLGTGTDTFYIDSTHTGETNLYAGDGSNVANPRDDTIAIRSISGVTTIHGQAGNDGILVNVKYDIAAAQFERTHLNGLDGVLNLHGEGGSDKYTINLAHEGSALINVHDNGAQGDGMDTLIVNGADVVAGLVNDPDDTFLLRRDFVALLNDSGGDNVFDQVERVNYDENINAGLFVNGLGGDDFFAADDNSAITTLDGGDDSDTFQIGQVFGTPRDIAANIEPGDIFDTTPVIIGIVSYPTTSDVIFDPTIHDLTQAVIDAINDAIVAAGNGPVDGIAYVSDGVSHATTVYGGEGGDIFSVYHNKATLRLEGQGGNDQFIVRAFVVFQGDAQANTEVSGGAGEDLIQYAINAPVSIDGGDGFDTLVVLGTPFADNVVVVEDGIFGAGLNVVFENVESAELDTLEGDDIIFVLSTGFGMVTTVIGGTGSDTVNVLGDVTEQIVSSDQDGNAVIMVFPPSAQDLDPINGPLIVEGGPVEGKDRSLVAAIVLPGELNPFGNQEDWDAEDLQHIDTLNVFHADNTDADSGQLFDRSDVGGIPVDNPGIALIGFDMGGDLVLDDGTVQLTYGGGITLNGFEIVEVLLGKGDESLAIGDTLDGAITVVHGGGGNDTITVSGRGEGPLVIYGDTSEDGVRYSNDTDDASVHATAFTNPGNDIVDASAMAALNDGYVGVVVYGGPGDDEITGSQDDDHFAGGEGTDTISGEAGNDHVYGDSHFNVDPLLFAQDQIDPGATTQQDIDAMFTVPTTGSGFGDNLYGGDDADVIFGDHGAIDQADGIRRIETTAEVIRIETVIENEGGADTISGGDDDDIILGGQLSDIIDGGAGNNIVIGDHGIVDYVFVDSDLTDIDLIESTSTMGNGGADTINSGAGNDIIIAGRYGDTVNVLGGNNIVIGDSGRITAANAGTPQIAGQAMTIGLIETIAFGDGGTDNITTGAGNDTVLGGNEADTIDAGDGNNIVLGDNGYIDYVVNDGDASDIDLIESTSTTANGGADDINAGSGNDIIIASRYGDTVNVFGGNNIVIGDSGRITAAATGTPQIAGQPITLGLIESIQPDEGGADGITTGNGHDLVLGGFAGDDVTAGAGNNIVIGDNGYIDYVVDGNAADIDVVTTCEPNLGGNDTIITGANNDILLGGSFDDTIHAGAGNDLVFGDHALLVGDVDGAALPLYSPAVFTFTAIDTQNTDAGGNDIVHAGDGDDIILGQQGNDTVYGEGGDDDIIGGHNVAGGHDADDSLDGGSGNDVIAGDNALIERRAFGDTDSPRIRVLSGQTIYGETPGVDDGLALVTSSEQANPSGVQARFITILDHSDTPAPNTSGNDYIAGGADDDVIFGQLGDDVIQGDGSIDTVVEAARDANGMLNVTPSDELLSDGDDYIEGNGGSDLIFGNLGRDDIVGGSSDLYAGLSGPETNRPDGSDLIFGGAGSDIARNNYGNGLHTRDADTIAGDNANIYRLVAIDGLGNSAFLTFGYDTYMEGIILIPHAVELLDYTEGGPDYDAASATNDNGGADEIHGESGDDNIHGQVGNDILFGEGQDDDLIGGWGHDWISGGTGDDGVIGDDGRIYTSRNGTAEPLYSIDALTSEELDLLISTPGNFQQSIINVSGALKKSVNLTPFNVNPLSNGFDDPLYVAQNADDIIYGGLGDDFLHGGSGDDAISGAEALDEFYSAPVNPGDVLGYGQVKAGEFAAYNEFDPWRKVLVNGSDFLLNFDAFDSGAPTTGETDPLGYAVQTDGNDRIFGDLGNDWLVGGTGEDNLYGGWGDDLLNADDDHDSTINTADPTANNVPDGPVASYEDIAYGGAGRDILIGNTGGDRLIDWAGEFNSYIVPFAPFGLATISRAVQPQIFDYLLDLSESDGADATRVSDTGNNDAARNGEPDGELGMVIQKDDDWQDQTGAPADPQPGNIPGGPRDVLRGADFNNGQAQGFAPDSGTWTIESGRLAVTPDVLGGEAVSVFYVDSMLPSYFEVEATINAAKPTAGWKSNAYLIFDYQSEYDFKFAGVNISTDKIEMGYRDASGWHVMVDTNAQLKPDRDYDLLLAINGTTVTLVVDNSEVFHHVYAPRVDADGWVYGLNYGMVGIGANNAKGRIDNVRVQVLPPETTFEATDDFDGLQELAFVAEDGNWAVNAGVYGGSPAVGGNFATSFIDLGIANGLAAPSLLELQTRISTDAVSGFIFDRYQGSSYKFAAIDANSDQLIIGHYSTKSGLVIDASFAFDIITGQEYRLDVTLKGLTVSASLWQVDVPMPNMLATVGQVFNAVSVDGDFGLFSMDGAGSFDDVTVKTDDPAFLTPGYAQAMTAASSQTDSAEVISDLTYNELDPIIDAAINLWTGSTLFDESMLNSLEGLTFVIADLTGDTLALTVNDTVVIDIDAAGHGWFIDDTPYQDSEFMPQNNDEVLRANESSDAYGDMDLLTVVMHELGHVFGYRDMDPATNDVEIMNETLDEGVRYLPEDTFSDQTQNSSDSLISMDLTPDESAADDTLDSLIDANPWLIKYLLNGAEDDTIPMMT